MFEVSRKDYIESLKSKRHNGLVKIITGLRRSGKSYLLFTLYKRFLLDDGILHLGLMDFLLAPESIDW